MRFCTYFEFAFRKSCKTVAKRRLRIRTRVWPHRPPFHPGPPFVISRSMISCSHLSARLSDVQMFRCFEINDWLVSFAFLMCCCVLEVCFTSFKVYWYLPCQPPFLPQIRNSHRLSDPGQCLGFLSIAQWSLGRWQPYHLSFELYIICFICFLIPALFTRSHIYFESHI